MKYKFYLCEQIPYDGGYERQLMNEHPDNVFEIRHHKYFSEKEIDLFCLANEEANFILTKKYHYVNYSYEGSIFNKKIKKMKKKIWVNTEYDTDYVTKMSTLNFPKEIKIYEKLDDVPDEIKSESSGREIFSQYKHYYIDVPTCYVNKVNETYKEAFSRHDSIIRLLVNRITQYGVNDLRISIKNDIIRYGNPILDERYKISFRDIGYSELPDILYQVAFAKELSKAIMMKFESQFTFEEVKISIYANMASLYPEDIRIDFKVSLKYSKLNNW